MGEVSEKYMRECEKLKSQLSQQEKAYATLMDQFNKLQAEKNNLQGTVKIKTAAIDSLQEENKKLLEKLDVAERELEKANHRLEFEINEKARVDRLYDEIKIKNANICSTIADMVRKIMQE